MAVEQRADGYWVVLRRQQYGRPVGAELHWGPYLKRADALAVERRNRPLLTGQVRRGDGPKPPRARQPRLLES